ncbi:MAG: DUF2017 domain-containing protein [Propionibacteriaceae bacterium]|jgi:hypothetical protein|nr:DUF2017 domain-containing protein [Propionibacteriaceae bacterium]
MTDPLEPFEPSEPFEPLGPLGQLEPTADAPVVELPLRSQEREFLADLTTQLCLLVAAPAQAENPLDNWVAALKATPLNHHDPVIGRLFPPASLQPDLAAEQRRLTEVELRIIKDDEARIVLADLAAADGQTPGLMIAADHGLAWLRTLNALRLSLAMRLGIESASAAEAIDQLEATDPRYDAAQIYHWLGYLLELVIVQMMPAGPVSADGLSDEWADELFDDLSDD